MKFPSTACSNNNIPTTTANEHKPRVGHVILTTVLPPRSDRPGSSPHVRGGKLRWREANDLLKVTQLRCV